MTRRLEGKEDAGKLEIEQSFNNGGRWSRLGGGVSPMLASKHHLTGGGPRGGKGYPSQILEGREGLELR